MIDHEKHLREVLEVQKKLSNEITELNNIISVKKEQYLKHQGIIDYLVANGIKPEENEKVTLTEK